MKRFFLLLLALAVPAAAQTAFQNYVMTELPKRPVMLTSQNVQDGGFDLDPNDGGPPTVLSAAPRGTFFLRATGPTLYVKGAPDAGTWSTVASGSSSLPLMTGPLLGSGGLHVETSGNDSTCAPGVSLPCASVAGAIAYLKSHFRSIGYSVDIILGTGNFPGFVVQGLTFDPIDYTLPLTLRIVGTMVNSTLATSTATGTFTAATTGDSTTAVFSTAADSVKTWTVNDLKGRFLSTLTGTSALQIQPITENTATQVTITQTSTAAGSVGGTYAIQDPGSIITTTVPIAPSLPAYNAASQTPTPIQASVAILGNTFDVQPGTFTVAPARIRIEQLSLNAASSVSGYRGLWISGQASVAVNRCSIGGTAASAGARVDVTGSAGRIQVTNSVIKTNASGVAINAQGFGAQNYDNDFVWSAATGTIGLSVSNVGPGTSANISFQNGKIEGHSFGVNITNPSLVALSGTRIASGGSQCIRSRLLDAVVGNIFINANSLDLSGATASSALEVSGPVFIYIATLKGTGNQYGVNLQQSAKLKTSSASDIVGTTSQVLLDGVASDFATMRAASPKVIANTYTTAFWE